MPGQLSIRIRMGPYEVEVSGTREEVLQTLESLGSIVETFSKALQGLPIQPAVLTSTVEQAGFAATSEQIPSAVTSPKSCGDAIMQLLRSEWGRAKPRTLNEILEALKANALHYPASTIGKTLQRLVQRNELRRWRTKNGYVYVAV